MKKVLFPGFSSSEAFQCPYNKPVTGYRGVSTVPIAFVGAFYEKTGVRLRRISYLSFSFFYLTAYRPTVFIGLTPNPLSGKKRA